MGDYEEGLDDELDVPTYRRLADDGTEPGVAPDTMSGAAAGVPGATGAERADADRGTAADRDDRTDDIDDISLSAEDDPGLFGDRADTDRAAEADAAPAAEAADADADAQTEFIERQAVDDDLPAGPAPHGVADGTGAGPLAGRAEGGRELADAAVSSPGDSATDPDMRRVSAADADDRGAHDRDRDGDIDHDRDRDPARGDGRADDAATTVMPRRDFYREAGRAAPQVIEPHADDTRDRARAYSETDEDLIGRDGGDPTVAAPAVGPGAAGAAGVAGLGATTAMSRHDDRDDDATVAGRAGDPDVDYAATGDSASDADAATAAAATSAPRESGDRDFVAEDAPDTRRGTLDLGLLLLRLGIGALLILQGLATIFQLGGAPGIGALEAAFADNNYAYAGVLAWIIPIVQLTAGGLLVLGAATPLGAALALGITAYLTMFEVATGSTGWNILAEGAEPVRLQLALTAAALALQFTGPGRYAVDVGFGGWVRRPLASSWIFCIIAIAIAVGLWYLTSGQLPFIDTTTGAAA